MILKPQTVFLTFFCALILFAGFSTSAWGQPPAGTGGQSGAVPSTNLPAETAPKSALSDFAWLEGRWQGEWGPRIAEQEWMAPKGGTMLGTFRLVENDKTLVIELFVLLEKPNGVELRLRHFTTELLPWEKAGTTVLVLASHDPMSATFENPVNGQPKHAVITRIDGDTYVSRSEIVPEKGDTQSIEITYHRQKPAAPQPNDGSGGRR